MDNNVSEDIKLRPVAIKAQMKNMNNCRNMIQSSFGEKRARLQVAKAQRYNPQILDERALYQEYNCQVRHKANRNAEIAGSALESLAADKDELAPLRKLRAPRFNNPSSPIPRIQLSEGEIKALAGFLLTI